MVIGIDDLLIVAAIAAISYGASELAASDSENRAEGLAKDQKKYNLDVAKTDYYRNSAAKAAEQLVTGKMPYTSAAAQLEPWAEKRGIERGYQGAMRAANANAGAMRFQGALNAGTTLAGGLLGGLRSGGGSDGFQAGQYASQLAGAAGDLSLDSNNSMLLADPGEYSRPASVRTVDPTGGYNLQPQDYALLSGSEPGQYNNTRGYRYTL